MKNTRNRTQTGLHAGMIAGLFLLLGVTGALAQDPSGEVIETESHLFERMAEGVYHARGTGEVRVISNALLIVGAHDALLVDSHVTPNAGRALLDAVAEVTDKPVRYLINSHYHFDHAHGNQAFPEEVEIIGHRFTREKLSGERGNVLEEGTFISFTENVPEQVQELERQVAEADDPERRRELEAQLSVQRAHMESLAETEPTPPNVTIEREMTIHQSVADGTREIQLLHLGRAHTAGDVVVYLPDEELVFTGDIMVPGLAYMGDAYVQDWPATLEALKTLEFDTILPGHGAPTQDLALIDHFQAYLRDLWQSTGELKTRGLNAEEAAEQVDMTGHSANFPQINGPGADVRAIRRIYELMDSED